MDDIRAVIDEVGSKRAALFGGTQGAQLCALLNRETAERLIAEGRMRPAGLAEIERAKADGRWEPK
jgi:uncharacterized protein YdeI (YjbR/CyaY-like superfamily)